MVNSIDLLENLLKEVSIFLNNSMSKTVGVPPPMYMVRNSPRR